MLIIPFIIVQVAAFVGLVFILRKVMISSSYAETKRLQQLNLENAAKARELEEKIQEAEKRYKEKMVAAEDEIRQLKEKAKHDAEHIQEDVIHKAKEEKERIIGQAINAKEKLREEIERELVDKSIDFSHKIFQQVFSAATQRLAFDGFLEEVFKDLEGLDRGNLKDVQVKSGKLVVRTSHDLSQKQKERLEHILTGKFEAKISVEQSVDKSLIAGIIIQMGSFMIDASLLARFKKAAADIRHGG